MKNKAFTLIELLVTIGICMGMIAIITGCVGLVYSAREANKTKIEYVIGDMVYIPDMNITGKVFSIAYNNTYVNILVNSTNGTVTKLDEIPSAIIKKVD